MDAQHLSSLFFVGMVSLLAAISPGPDFVIVVRNSLVYSRKMGFLTAFGVAMALIIHLTYTMVGIGVLLAENSWAYNILKFAGAGYLFYLGITGIVASFKMRNSDAFNLNYKKAEQEISSFNAFKQGFLTNALNPKCAMFFISLFSQFITADTPLSLRIEYAFVNWSVSLGWFLLLTYMITGKLLKNRLDRFRAYIDRVMGTFLILLSLKLIFV